MKEVSTVQISRDLYGKRVIIGNPVCGENGLHIYPEFRFIPVRHKGSLPGHGIF
jgi:hypothetical protein